MSIHFRNAGFAFGTCLALCINLYGQRLHMRHETLIFLVPKATGR
jgi:hypothetical protein